MQAKEHAAAEKQLAAHAPTVPSAGSAIQLKAAPILKKELKTRRSRRQKVGFQTIRDQRHTGARECFTDKIKDKKLILYYWS